MKSDRNADREVSPETIVGDAEVERSLRPRTFDEYVGQDKLKANLRVFCQAARQRHEPLDHVLFCGPPGLGKTTLAHIIAAELGSVLHVTSGPAIENRAVLAAHLTNLGERDVLFIDEIHRLQPAVEEYLYPAMEDFVLDITHGQGAHAPTLRYDLRPFTLVGATTRTGLLASPLRDRFGIVERLDYYTEDDLRRIVRRSAGILAIAVEDDAAAEIGRRARGTPRIANRLLRRVRDFAQVEGKTGIDRAQAAISLERLEVDAGGLDALDRRLLRALIEKFDGGPVGIETLAVVVGEESDTLQDVYEPFLVQGGWIARTPRGRVAAKRAYEHLGLAERVGRQAKLF
jgi:Holliday junction DNA helicase RuvB